MSNLLRCSLVGKTSDSESEEISSNLIAAAMVPRGIVERSKILACHARDWRIRIPLAPAILRVMTRLEGQVIPNHRQAGSNPVTLAAGLADREGSWLPTND